VSLQLSYSAATKYNMSPRAYYLHYVLRLREKNLSSPLFFGAALDEGLNALLSAKRDGRTVSVPEAQEVFTNTWRTARVNDKDVDLSQPGVIKYSKADFDAFILTDEDKAELEVGVKDPGWISLRRKGLMMIEAYAEQVIPRIREVLFVQKDIKLSNEEGDSFVGFIDFCAVWEDGRTVIFDNKSSSIKYTETSAKESQQLATYFEATRDDLKVDAVGYVVLPKKFRKQKLPIIPIGVIIGDVDEKVVDETFEMYDNALTGIKMGEFPCTRHIEGGCCDAPWGCTYRRYCESNGQDLTGLVYHEKKK